MEIVFKHVWVGFIVVMFVNGAIFWYRAKPYIEKNPELEEGYRTIIRGFVIYGNVPWVVMGLGVLVGGVPSIFHFSAASQDNPWVLAWFGSFGVLWVLLFNWVFLRGGAEMLVRHPGIFNAPVSSPATVKLVTAALVAAGLLGTVLLFTRDFSPPSF